MPSRLDRCGRWVPWPLAGIVFISGVAAGSPATDRALYSLVPSQGSDDVELSNAPRALNLVGFQCLQDVSRVIVRTNEKAKYSVRKVGDKRVVVEIQNTRVMLSNNERFLDTQFFNSPVKLIQPEGMEGGTPTVRVDIELRRPATFTERQVGNELWIEFPNAG